MTVTGTLETQLNGLVASFNGADLVNKYDSGSFLLVYNYPVSVNLVGTQLRVPGSGEDFITGNITKLTYSEITLSPSLTFHEKLEFSEINFDATTMFDLISRTSTTATGTFDISNFRLFLSQQEWTIQGSDEADIIEQTAHFQLNGNDVIRTDNGSDRVAAGNGSDKIFGGKGKDTLDGQSGKDKLSGGSGNDHLLGGNGNDRLSGDNGQDQLYGGHGRDKLLGGKGNDNLSGGKGNDQLTGGAGADEFVFSKGGGADTIRDFDLSQDQIRINRGASEFSDLEITQTGDTAMINFANVSITLRGIDADDLTADLFIF
jgi:Ca2+-binding RTX toxin-like protein